MDKVNCIGLSAASLSASDVEKLTLLAKSPGLLKIECYPNFDATGDDIPSGIAMYFDAAAKVDATIVSDKMFQCLVTTNVQHAEGMNDITFVSKKDAINSGIKQYSSEPASIKNHSDRAPWSAELGGPGSFAGVFYKLSDDHATKSYHIAAKGTVPLLVQDFKRRLGEETTYGELVSDKKWISLMGNMSSFSQRNAKRNLATIASICGVDVPHRRVDLSAVTLSADIEGPDIADTLSVQQTFSIKSSLLGVAIYCGVIPRSELKREVLVTSGGNSLLAYPLGYESILKCVPADGGKDLVQKKVEALIVEGKLQDMSSFKAPSKEVMKSVGWNAENQPKVFVPIVLKVFNPELRRK